VLPVTDNQQQKLLGYFAVVFLGLLSANALADWAIVLARPHVPWITAYQGLATSALFFGVCFANPFIWAIGQANMRSTVIWAVAGLAFGATFHLLIVEPLIGMALSRFMMLFVAALGVPVMMLRGWWRRMALRRKARNRAQEIQPVEE